MSLANLSTSISVSTSIPDFSYDPNILKIFNEDEEIVDNSSIYLLITKPPTIVNETEEYIELPQWKINLAKVHSVTMIIALIILMSGMGCHVYWKELLGNFWPPLPILIGMTGQFVLMPALAYTISIIFKMEPYVALGCLIISCSPGGAFSNFFTYWVNGDVALSLVMTTCSTLLSFGAMPLNLWIYASRMVGEDSDDINIPYKNIVFTLGIICGPVVIGMVIRHFKENIARRITQITSIIGYILVTFAFTVQFILYGKLMVSANWYIHVSVIVLPTTALILAYLTAYLTKRSHKICRTIAIETASQNIPVALGIVLLSFSDIEVRNKMLLYPSLYGVYMFSEIILGSVIYRIYYNQKQKSKLTKDAEATEHNVKH